MDVNITGDREVSFGKKSDLKLLLALIFAVLIFCVDFLTRAKDGFSGLYVIVVLMASVELPSMAFLFVSSACAVAAGVTNWGGGAQLTQSQVFYAAINFIAFSAAGYFAHKLKARETGLGNRLSIIEKTYDAVLIRDRDDKIVYWNKGAQKLYGWSPHDAVGRLPDNLLKTVFPETKGISDEKFLRDDKWEGELSQVSKDGQRVIVQSRWLLERDAAGEPLVAIEANRNITPSQREGLDIDAKPAKFDDFRSAMLAQMTSTIAHELSQPLSASITSAEAALRWLKNDVQNIDEAHSAVKNVISSAKRAGDVIIRVRQMAEREEVMCEAVPLNTVLTSSLSANQDLILRHHIEPILSLAADLSDVRGNRKLLEKVFTDLLAYVFETLPPADVNRATIASSKQVSDAGVNDIVLYMGSAKAVDDFEQLVGHAKRPDGFANDVIGSTLSVCRFVIESHSWRIDALSDPTLGAAFRIRIPAKKDIALEK